MQIVCDEKGSPLPEVRICFPAAVRMRFSDGVSVVAIVQNVDGPVRMGDGKLCASLESATDAAYQSQKRLRPKTAKERLPGTLLWTLNVQGVSITYGKLDIRNMAANSGRRHPIKFPSLCVNGGPIDQIVESNLFTGKLQSLLKVAYRPVNMAPTIHTGQAEAKKGKRRHVAPHDGGMKKGVRRRCDDDDEMEVEEDDSHNQVVDFDLRRPASEWTSQLFEKWCMQNKLKTPILKSIDDYVLPYGGIGNPKLHITIQHPKTREDVNMLVSSTVMHMLPAYAAKLNNFNAQHNLWN